VRASGDWGGRRSWRPWHSRLWILAAALGAASIFSSVALVHSSYQHRAVVRLLAQSTAEQVVDRAAARLQVLAARLLPPVEGEVTRPSSAAALLPVSAWFRLDPAGSKLTLIPAAGAALHPLPAESLLSQLARAAAGSEGDSLVAARLTVAPALGDYAMVTEWRPGDSELPPRVSGFLAPTGAVLAAVFRLPATAPPRDSLLGLARLDTLSLQVMSRAGAALFGRLGAERSARATVLPRGPLEGLAVTVALGRDQIPAALLMSTSRTQLWQNGFLLLSTLLVILLAVGSSRRELQLARARSDFIAGVSHDLRMPLAQILLAGETLTLQRERDAADRLSLAGSIVREAQRLIGLVDNVLLFSRSGAVAERPRLEPVSVAALLDDVVTAVRLSAEDAGQTVEAVADSDLAVLGDRRLLRQALVNLIDNALKYGSPGQRIRLAAAPGAPGWVRLHVEDQGPGVPADQRSRVFEPYERLLRDQASERTGSGLGLAVVRHIALVCRGRVWLEEAAGGGTRAVLELEAPKAA